MHGNRVMLGQVVTNLIVNACEVQPEKGEVRVCSRLADGQVVAEVADRGPGHRRGRPAAHLRAVLLDQGLDRPGPVDLSYDHAPARRRTGRAAAAGRRRGLPDEAAGAGGRRSGRARTRERRRLENGMSERTGSRGRVLVVEDEAYVRESLVEILRTRRYETSAAALGGRRARAPGEGAGRRGAVGPADARRGRPRAGAPHADRRARRARRHPHRPRQRRLRRRMPQGRRQRLHPEARRARGARGGPRPCARGARAAPRGALPAQHGGGPGGDGYRREPGLAAAHGHGGGCRADRLRWC